MGVSLVVIEIVCIDWELKTDDPVRFIFVTLSLIMNFLWV